MDEKKRVYIENPLLRSSFISKLLFSWISPLIKLGSTRTLNEHDLYCTLPYEKTEYLADRIEIEWKKELLKKNPSLARALSRFIIAKILLVSILVTIQETLKFLQPILITMLLRYFTEEISLEQALIIGSIICLSVLVQVLVIHQYYYLIDRFGMRLRLGCSGLIYRKLLRLNPRHTHSRSSLNVINLLTNDLSNIESSLTFIPYVIIAPLEIIATVTIFVKMVDKSILSGFGVFLVLLPIQMLIIKLFNYYRRQISRQTDNRISLISEAINGIKIIKMYCWENSFRRMINAIRSQELRYQSLIYMIRAINSSIDLDFGSLINYASIATFVFLANKPLLPKYVVFSLSYYSRLCATVGFFFVRALTYIIAANVSLKRVKEYYMQPEVEIEKQIVGNHVSETEEASVKVKDLVARWTEHPHSFSLNNISFEVNANNLMSIIGPVGSGKTSLLLAILGEIPYKQRGDVDITGSVFYVSQEPWIFSASLKQNILFGKEYSSEKFNRVVDICALREDIEHLPKGESTLIGDKGVNLSGGQRARVNLARALYHDPDIYLFDDPLSAVDASVAKHLFDNCINGYLRYKVRILVTHQVHHLKNTDTILALSEGRINALGKYDAVKASPYFNHDISAKENKLKVVVKELSDLENQLEEELNNNSFELIKKDDTSVERDYVEKPVVGKIRWNTFWRFLNTSVPYVGALVPFLILSLFMFVQGFLMGADFWSSHWASVEEIDFKAKEERRSLYESCLITRRTSAACRNVTIADATITRFTDRMNYFVIHTIIIVIAIVFIMLRSTIYYLFFLNTTRLLHRNMLNSILYAKTRFFDINPTGRIMNRFSKDVSNVDDSLPHNLFNFLQCTMILISSVVVAVIINYFIIIPLIPIVIAFLLLRRYYIKSARELKRVEAIKRSPVLIHVSNTLLGLTTIRACKNQDILKKEFYTISDDHTQAYFSMISVNKWFGIRLDFIAVIYTIFVVFGGILLKEYFHVPSGQMGLLFTTLLTIMSLFQWTIRESADVETLMTSVERIVEYCDVNTEDIKERRIETPKNWPNEGKIEFDNVSYSYDVNLPDVLKNITLTINPREKIGIVGRTGAGKSTFFQALYRMAELEGRILVDNVDINDISLHDLRSKIAIIPQESTMFFGTVRSNLDPFNEHSDLEIWDALKNVQLTDLVEEMQKGLDSKIQNGGSNLSVGQKQLFCLARAILRKNKILIIDEATANVDFKTDELVQKAIRECFGNCTILTIAHRLQTIIDSDKIIVISGGKVVCFDTPYNLLIEDQKSAFYKLVHKLDRNEVNRIMNAVRSRYAEERQ